jgi:menaquinone-dependent protoporphyrinogen IX oxidase
MSASALVAYATRYGSTQEVAEAVAAMLRERGLTVDSGPMRQVRTLKNMPASDVRDWTAIRAWANDLAAQFQPALT